MPSPSPDSQTLSGAPLSIYLTSAACLSSVLPCRSVPPNPPALASASPKQLLPRGEGEDNPTHQHALDSCSQVSYLPAQGANLALFSGPTAVSAANCRQPGHPPASPQQLQPGLSTVKTANAAQCACSKQSRTLSQLS